MCNNAALLSELHLQRRRFGEELNRYLQEARTALMIQELEIKR